MKTKTAKAHWSKVLVYHGACHEAVEWARTQKSATAAWNNCERGDHMLWIAGKLSGDPDSASRKLVVLAACACARLSLGFVLPGEARPLKAIETAEAWARGRAGVTLDDVRRAAYAADAAANEIGRASCRERVCQYV